MSANVSISPAEPPTAARPNHSTQPVLTLYPGGVANLNGEAVRQLPRRAESVLLLPPAPGRRHWLLLAGNGLLAGHDGLLCSRKDRPGSLRFRAAAMARSLFAALPEAQGTLHLVLEPEPLADGLFRLKPV